MDEGERVAALRGLERARRAYRRASLELAGADAASARWEGGGGEGRRDRAGVLAYWYARRAELLRMSLDAAERVAAIHAALHAPDRAPPA